MSGDDILAKVRKALHLADSIEAHQSPEVERLLRAADRARTAQEEFLTLLREAQPTTLQGQQAKATLLYHYTELQQGEALLQTLLRSNGKTVAEIHTALPPSQVQ